MKTYSQEQLDIEILKVKTDSTGKTLDNLTREIQILNGNMKQQFSNFTNYILGIYGLILASTLAKLSGFL